MKRRICIALALSHVLACASPVPPKQSPNVNITDVAPPTVSRARRPVQNRRGLLTELKLNDQRCNKGSDFVDAIARTAPLVVGVAAGELADNQFAPKELGSGIILSRSGLILAHYHTILDFSKIRIRLLDGTVKEAEWLGEDRRSDLVLLKIEAGDYPEPTLASADTLSIGQWVASLGSPFGLQQSISAGLISDQSRAYPSPVESKLVRFVQSDVVIHPGSSGGPLIDACGRIVAMNSAILGPGMSFSLRIDEALVIAEKLDSEGEFDRGFAGMTVHHINRQKGASELKIKRVVPNGPAQKAGIQSGDRITHVNDEEISTEYRLKWLVAITEPGEPIRLRIEREGVSSIKNIEVESSL